MLDTLFVLDSKLLLMLFWDATVEKGSLTLPEDAKIKGIGSLKDNSRLCSTLSMHTTRQQKDFYGLPNQEYRKPHNLLYLMFSIKVFSTNFIQAA